MQTRCQTPRPPLHNLPTQAEPIEPMTADEDARAGADDPIHEREARQSRVDRLLDAIELVKEDRREEARVILRELIRQDGNFAEAWLWMSVAVDSVDQAAISLENVLRVNPHHFEAAGALYHLRSRDAKMERRRTRLRMWRDVITVLFWTLVMGILFVVVFSAMQV